MRMKRMTWCRTWLGWRVRPCRLTAPPSSPFPSPPRWHKSFPPTGQSVTLSYYGSSFGVLFVFSKSFLGYLLVHIFHNFWSLLTMEICIYSFYFFLSPLRLFGQFYWCLKQCCGSVTLWYGWIRILGSVPLTNGFGSVFGSCYFRLWPSRWTLKKIFFLIFFLTFWSYIYIIFQR